MLKGKEYDPAGACDMAKPEGPAESECLAADGAVSCDYDYLRLELRARSLASCSHLPVHGRRATVRRAQVHLT